MDRWLHAQRLGVTASVLLTHSGTHSVFRAARKILQADMSTGEIPSRGFDFFRTLPPWVLSVLARGFKQKIVPKLNPFGVLAEKAFQHNLKGWDDDTSTIARAQILAYHVLLANTSAEDLLKLGTTFFGHYDDWLLIDASPTSLEQIASCLLMVRDPRVSTREKCYGIQKLSVILGNTPYWPQVENILYHSQFCWPLVVFDSTTAQDSSRNLALSLPVAVDVIFDNRCRICQSTEAGVIISKWEEQLRRSIHAAKALWRSEHENCGTFRDLVKNASVSFDFSCAEKIVEKLAGASNARISLADRSAEAYFAEVVLGRLLGRGRVMVNAVTGVIGDQVTDEHGARQPNFPFDPPSGMLAKVEYASNTGIFECIVLPNARESREAIQAFFRKSELSNQANAGTSAGICHPIEVLYAQDMQTISDQVYPSGWRQHQYVRCPEVEWAIHSEGSPGLISALDDERVQETIAKLASHDSTMLDLDVSPMLAASALWHINDSLRLQRHSASWPLSWAFINVSAKTSSVFWDDERDVFFWELLFRAIGAGPDQLLPFLRHFGRGEAINQLARFLNRFVPVPDQPERSPDLIVIIGRQTLSKSKDWPSTQSYRLLMVSRILDDLRNRLCPIGEPHSTVFRLLGKTRIIILPDAVAGTTAGKPSGNLGDLNDHELLQLRILATVEDSITRRTAGLLLSHSQSSSMEISRHDVLESLVEKGFVRQIHGNYHVPSYVAEQIRFGEKTGDKIKRYYAAGVALAPYAIDGQASSSMAVDTAFVPDYLEEAYQHFRSAYYYSTRTRETGATKFRSVSRKAMELLTRFAMVPSWPNVSRLLQGSKSLRGAAALGPYEKACELLRWHEEEGIPPHPLHLVTAARSAVRAATCVYLYRCKPGPPTDLQARCEATPLQLHAKARKLYRLALKDAAGLPESEREVTLLFSLTKYLVYLCRRHWVLIEHETQSDLESKETEIRHCWSEVMDLMNRRVKLLRPECLECFERMGDREPDHARALPIYMKGVETKLILVPLSLKAWGAASLCGISGRINNSLKGFPVWQKGHLVYDVFYNSLLYEAEMQPHEITRIEEGLRVFEDQYGNRPKVMAAKKSFLRHYGEPVRRRGESLGLYLRGVVTHLKFDQRYGFICDENGCQYRFQSFRLVEGLEFEDIYEGMDLDFQILKQRMKGAEGDAVNVRRPRRPMEKPIQTGMVSALKPNGRYGFIFSAGKPYHFHESYLSEGTVYDQISEGMRVEFQIGIDFLEGNGAGGATDVRPIQDGESSIISDSSSSTGVRGIIGVLKHRGRYGFISSAGKRYHFHASYLSQGLQYGDLYEGMEVEFDVTQEAVGAIPGQGKRVREFSDVVGCDKHASDVSEAVHESSTVSIQERCAQALTGLTRRGVVSLFKQHLGFGFVTTNDTDHFFEYSDLQGGLTSMNVYEGMEVEFEIEQKETERASAGATKVRPTLGVEAWKTLSAAEFITGRLVFLKIAKKYGYIRTAHGQDYYFCQSDLREGLIFYDLRQGMEVEFQVREQKRDSPSPEAMNVRPIPDIPASKHQPLDVPAASSPSMGTIYLLERSEDYGFILSASSSEYHFHASDLAEGVGYNEVYIGMEVEFRILREGEGQKAGKAVQVSPARDLLRRALSPIKGVVYSLTADRKRGFITSSNGKEYRFTVADLIGGLEYEDIHEGTEVSFLIRREAGGTTGTAVCVSLARD
jgi:cold shock CspA family protein